MKPVPEFMMRVKLPSSSGYHCGPSGDTEYESDYRQAILAALPEGFEVCWPRAGHRWPVDSEGFTYVRLRCDDPKNALAKWRESATRASEALRKAHCLAEQILGVTA